MGDVDEGPARRAAMHAALGEPVRLALVDRLVLGDASPGELGGELGIPTNLLAHHLRVLDQAGVIRRVRSEGDRRRSYVQLVTGDPLVAQLTGPLAPVAGGAGQAARVVFVCTHNSARSPLAAAAWSRISAVPAASAGTDPAPRVHPRAVRVARRHDLDLGQARTAGLAEVVQPGDLVVAVCDSAHEELAAPGSGTSHPVPSAGRLHWSVPDPARADTDAAFEAAYQQITARVGRLADAFAADSRQVPAQRAVTQADGL